VTPNHPPQDAELEEALRAEISAARAGGGGEGALGAVFASLVEQVGGPRASRIWFEVFSASDASET
jgi:hypothetical protein